MMLYHEFYFRDSSKGYERKPGDEFIRISDELIKKMEPDLKEYKFAWCEYDEPRYGFGSQVTVMSPEEVRQLKECLLKQSENEWEYHKFMWMLDKALKEGRELVHDGGEPWGPYHSFVICDKLPTEETMKDRRIDYRYYMSNYLHVHMPDQFIMKNYDVFKHVQLYWGSMNKKGGGFDYYGHTWITPQMAQELLDLMDNYLKDDISEAAEYFVGEEYDLLVSILKTAIAENKVVLHFGI